MCLKERHKGMEAQRHKGRTKSEKVKVKNVFKGKAQRHRDFDMHHFRVASNQELVTCNQHPATNHKLETSLCPCAFATFLIPFYHTE